MRAPGLSIENQGFGLQGFILVSGLAVPNGFVSAVAIGRQMRGKGGEGGLNCLYRV